MKLRLILLASLLSAVATSASAHTDVSVSFGLGVPSPPPRVVVVPPRDGFVWSPGFWQWDGYRNVWIEGHWLRARESYRWPADDRREAEYRYRDAPERWEHEEERHEHEWREHRRHEYEERYSKCR